MQIDSEDLLARIRQEFPHQFEMARLHLLVDLLQPDNERLTAIVGQQEPPLSQTSVIPTAGFAGVARPYVRALDDEDGSRHGG